MVAKYEKQRLIKTLLLGHQYQPCIATMQCQEDLRKIMNLGKSGRKVDILENRIQQYAKGYKATY